MLLGSIPPEANGLPATGVSDPSLVYRQHGDLVAAGVNCQQVASVVGHLDRALRPDARTETDAAGAKRRSRERGQRAIRVANEPGDRVRGGGVVVEVHIVSIMVASMAAVCGRGRWPHQGRCEQRDGDRHARKKAHRFS